MSTTRSKRLAAGKLTATGDVTVYTCPSGKITLVKGITAFKHGSDVVPSSKLSLASGTGYVPQPFWHVLEAGDLIILNAATANVVLYWISGAELTA